MENNIENITAETQEKTFVFQPVNKQTEMTLPIFIGKDQTGMPIYKDLSKAVHLLVSGTTGSGKSVFINALIASLLNTKVDLKFCMIDPKRVELAPFKDLGKDWFFNNDGPITDNAQAGQALNDLCIEMGKRYETIQNLKVRNITEANLKGCNMPYIVCIIDEFADLIMANKEIEISVVRLAQLGRASGIHVIIATQRPSAEVITGLIKSNFPTRVAFRTASKIDSRIILDNVGAELLNGNGDMLWSNGARLEHMQGCFISNDELNSIIQSKRIEPVNIINTEPLDEMTIDAGKLFYEYGVSASLLQRRLKLGYTRSWNIINALIEANVITPYQDGKAEIKMSYTQFLQIIRAQDNI